MPLFQQGTWGVGNFKLPDLGITEAFGGSRSNVNNPAVYKGGALFVQRPAGQSQAQGIPSTSNNVLGTNSTGFVGPTYNAPSGGGSNAYRAPAQQPAGMNTLLNNVNQQQQTGFDAVDRDYENFISDLNNQQSQLQSQGGLAEEKVRNAASAQETAIGRERTQAGEGFTTQEQTANKQSTSAMQQARDIYGQVQQRNIAQLSASGLSSSSVAESMAETLGRDTARRIAGITGTRDEVIQNITKERSNINNYLNERLTQVKDNLGLSIKEIQQNVLNQLNQINSSRNVAANDRATARQRIVSDAQSSIANLNAQAQDFQQQLEMKMQERQQSLAAAASAAERENQRFANELPQIMAAAQSFGLGGMPQQQSEVGGYLQPRRPNPNEFDYSQYGL